jgi:glyoxylase-like metal-dependent hydrolase (beta-lactamase superfamily II)
VNPIARVTVPVATRAPTGTTHAYVVGSDPAVLIDPADRTDELDRLVEDRSVEAVAVTHTHPDHVDGVVDYADGRTVWAHADHRGRFADATGVEPDRTFRDGDRLPGGLEVLATPGHAVDHVALARGSASEESAGGDGSSAGENPRGESILVGDLAVAEGSVVVGAPEGDMRAYLESLRRIRDREPAVLYPGHGPAVEDPESTLTRLIEHRLERERKVRAAVEAGAERPEAITDRAYEKDLTGVRDLAKAAVVAHLEKLAAEGAIAFDGERARPA